MTNLAIKEWHSGNAIVWNQGWRSISLINKAVEEQCPLNFVATDD